MRYITIRYRKDRRITIGTMIHKNLDCPKIRPESARAVTGEILRILPKCKICFNK
jgi:hypothetical protein